MVEKSSSWYCPIVIRLGRLLIAERLLQAVRKDTIVLAEATVSVTLSAGVATSGVIQDA